MKLNASQTRVTYQACRSFLALLLAALLVPGDAAALALQEQKPAASSDQPEAKIPNDQLDALVAPIALYPDPLLSQTLVASTYPLEIIQLQQWLTKNPKLKDKELADAVAKQPWDPSIQAMAALPEVVKRLADDIQWATDLGNAFLAQQGDVMDAVQRMRKKAQDTGALKSSEQMKVETQVIESKSVIVVQQAQPEVVYVPSYNPVVVYGPPVYPYPPVYYPPSTGAVIATAAISFGVGLAMGAAWGGGWGYGCGWGGNNVNINVNNNYVRNNNINNVQGGNRNNVGSGNNTWQHNSQHRGNAPYSNQSTANKYGGNTRGASASDRQGGAASNRTGGGGAGVSNNRAGGNAGGAGASNRASGSAGGGDRVGKQSVSSSRSSGASGLGGGGGGMSGGSARASSSRGSSSMRGGGGGGRR